MSLCLPYIFRIITHTHSILQFTSRMESRRCSCVWPKSAILSLIYPYYEGRIVPLVVEAFRRFPWLITCSKGRSSPPVSLIKPAHRDIAFILWPSLGIDVSRRIRRVMAPFVRRLSFPEESFDPFPWIVATKDVEENVARSREMNLFATNNVDLRDRSLSITYAAGINSRVFVIHGTIFNGINFANVWLLPGRIFPSFATRNSPLEDHRIGTKAGTLTKRLAGLVYYLNRGC